MDLRRARRDGRRRLPVARAFAPFLSHERPESALESALAWNLQDVFVHNQRRPQERRAHHCRVDCRHAGFRFDRIRSVLQQGSGIFKLCQLWKLGSCTRHRQGTPFVLCRHSIASTRRRVQQPCARGGDSVFHSSRRRSWGMQRRTIGPRRYVCGIGPIGNLRDFSSLVRE